MIEKTLLNMNLAKFFSVYLQTNYLMRIAYN